MKVYETLALILRGRLRVWDESELSFRQRDSPLRVIVIFLPTERLKCQKT
jgi:hypothetical protein